MVEEFANRQHLGLDRGLSFLDVICKMTLCVFVGDFAYLAEVGSTGSGGVQVFVVLDLLLAELRSSNDGYPLGPQKGNKRVRYGLKSKDEGNRA